MKLGDIAHYAGCRIPESALNATNYVGVENLLQGKQGKTGASTVPTTGNVIKFDCEDILIGNIRPYLQKIWLADCDGGTNGDVLTIQIDDKTRVLPRYLYYVLSSEHFFAYDMQNAKGAKMPRGDKNVVMEYVIPLPPIDVQRRIVATLDRFDALCNDLTAGLPAEIEARKKQYEYYRDKLLLFKEVMPDE